MPANCVSVTRPGILGNPFKGPDAVARFRTYALLMLSCYNTLAMLREATAMGGEFSPSRACLFGEFRKKFVAAMRRIAEERLSVACYCSCNSPCHGDVVLDIAADIRKGNIIPWAVSDSATMPANHATRCRTRR